ncbi:MAG: hypothetical protein K0S38_898, partial [Candidatus Paceibacter sp.]|nr:hypothetical protein [Candidatus Paceibacter sp.]
MSMRKGPYFEPTAGSLVPVIRILVVEDEKGTADRVAYELRTLFGELAIVDVAYTLNQAISLLKKNVYHL